MGGPYCLSHSRPTLAGNRVSYVDLPPVVRELLVLWWAEVNNTHKEVYFYAHKYRSG